MSPSPGPECICTRAFFCLLSDRAQASALHTHGLSTLPWPQALEHLLNGGVLSPDDASALMEAWLSEDLTPVQTGVSGGFASKGSEWSRTGGDGLGAACSLSLARWAAGSVDG